MPPKAKADFSSADAAFARLFRVPRPVPADAEATFDRLSMLACQRQGIAPTELLPGAGAGSVARANGGDPGSPGARSAVSASSTRIEESKADVANKRRLAKINIVELERRSIVDVVFRAHQDKQEKGKLTHEQEQVQSELHAVQQQAPPHPDDSGTEPRALANNPAEAAAVKELLGQVHDLNPQRKKLLKTIEDTKRHGEEEIEKMRKRQLRFVMNDVQREVEKQEIQAHIADKERQFKEKERQRQQQIEEQAATRAKNHRRKMTALRIRNEVLYQHKKEELEHRERQQHETYVRLMKQKAEHVEKLRRESERKAQLGREKAETVREQDALKCELLQKDLETADEIHDHRRDHLQLQMHVRREQRRVDAWKKHVRAQQNVDAIDDGTQEVKARLEANENAVQENRQRRLAEREERIKRQQQEEEEARQLAEQRRVASAQRRERRNVELLREEVRHEEVLRAVRAEKEEDRELRRELDEQKRQEHQDNMERIRRLQDYRQSVKDRLLREAQQRDRANKQMRLEMSTKLQRARQRLVQDREEVNTQIVRMRSSPRFRQLPPKEMLAETMASIERSGQRKRAVSASTRAGQNDCAAANRTPADDSSRPGTAAPPDRSDSTANASRDKGHNAEGTTATRETVRAATPKQEA